MLKFTIVSSPSLIHIDEEWENAIEKFKSVGEPTYVNDKGKKVSETIFGKKYELISIRERQLTRTERFGRKFLFVLAMVFTLGLAYFSKSVYKLYKKETGTWKIALYPKTTSSSLPLPFSSTSKEEFQNKTIQGTSKPEKTAAEKSEKFKKAIPKPVKVNLPPLPKLKSIAFDPEKEWMKTVSRDPFIRPEKIETAVIQTIFGASKEEIGDIHSSILDISLENWFHPEKLLAHEKKELDKPQFKIGLESIQKRIKDLNESIQLEERLKRINFLTLLKVKDLLVSWDKSSLKVSLMMEDELAELKISDLKECNIDDPMVIYRLTQIGKQQTSIFDQTTLSSENVQEILFINLCKLKAYTLNQLAKDLPLFAFSLISKSEIPQIKMEALSAPHLKALLCSEKRVKKLSITQVNACVDKMEENSLGHLTKDQILNLDFSKINKKKFAVIFSPYADHTKELLQKFSLEKIYEICHNFENKHWQALSNEQILKLDFSKIDEKIFKALFSPYDDRTKTLLQKYSNEKINEICQFFEDKHWQILSNDQIFKFDFSKIDEKIFKAIFSPYDTTRTTKLLQKYSNERIYEICQFFEDKHWKMLSDEQIFKLDFSKIDETSFKAIFSPYDHSRTSKLLQKYSNARVYEVCQYFEDKHWKMLSDEQILYFDFSKINETICQSIFSPYDHSRTKGLFSKISDSQLMTLKQYIGSNLHHFLSKKQKELLKLK